MSKIDLTSDRITNLSEAEPFDFPSIELMRVNTEKGNRFFVDKARFRHLVVGDEIEIFIKTHKEMYKCD